MVRIASALSLRAGGAFMGRHGGDELARVGVLRIVEHRRGDALLHHDAVLT